MEFSERLLAWYDENARALPWRENKNPYFVWVSEMMLQQTRVEAVKEYFVRFVQALPTVQDLANVDDEVLMKLWQGLGYYRRAQYLKHAANTIVNELCGKFPTTAEGWQKLKGVGEYASGAIASIAFDQKATAVDGNVMRVFARLFALQDDISKPQTKAKITAMVQQVLPSNRVGDFNQALMELGATVCLPNGQPHCTVCPFYQTCLARQNGIQNQLPVKEKQKSRIVDEKTVLLLMANEKLLLHKRPSHGLLSNLWEPLNLEGLKSENEITEHLSSLGLHATKVETLEKAKHIFTHREWHMNAMLVQCEQNGNLAKEYEWVSKKELETTYSVPNAFSAFLKQLKW